MRPHREVLHYREFVGIRRNGGVFEAFIDRYCTLVEERDWEWRVEDLQHLPTAEAQRMSLRQRGYREDGRSAR